MIQWRIGTIFIFIAFVSRDIHMDIVILTLFEKKGSQCKGLGGFLFLQAFLVDHFWLLANFLLDNFDPMILFSFSFFMKIKHVLTF